MSEGSERTKERLENLRNLEPLIGAMRILALRTVQLTLNRLDNLEIFRSNFTRALATVQRELGRRKRTAVARNRPEADPYPESAPKRTILVVFGSESGLCGGYDRGLLSALRERIADRPETEFSVEICGEKMLTRLKNETLPYRALGSFSRNGNPNYEVISTHISSWYRRFESGEVSAVELISFRKSGLGSYLPASTMFLPEADDAPAVGTDPSVGDDADWPPPLIEGDPAALADELRRHVSVTRFYTLLLESIAAENQARFRLLEEAKENTSALIEELKIQAQLERRQATTQQIQELAVSAGLVR